MRPSVWANSARDVIINKLYSSIDPEVKQWALLLSNTDDSTLFTEFKEKMKLHDKYRSTNFAKTFPELAKYI
jgi:hypothetical protein